MHTLDEVNRLDAAAFAALFGSVYEHSPWVADRAAAERPFASVEALAETMRYAVATAPREAKLALIRLHPRLLGRLAPTESLTAESRNEQASAGLDRCTEGELDQLNVLNAAYAEKFSFPFVVAVRGLSVGAIIVRMRERIDNDPEVEFLTALREISKIADLRLSMLVQ